MDSMLSVWSEVGLRFPDKAQSDRRQDTPAVEDGGRGGTRGPAADEGQVAGRLGVFSGIQLARLFPRVRTPHMNASSIS